jgi:hypothetical protein
MPGNPTDIFACKGCGKPRFVNRGKKRGPTPLCRTCTVLETDKCTECPFIGNKYAMANHRRKHRV